MPPAALVGVSTINSTPPVSVIGPGSVTTKCDGVPVALVGDAVAPHFPNTGLHLTPVIVQGSTTVKIDGTGVAYVGCLLNCGHMIITGSATTEVGP